MSRITDIAKTMKTWWNEDDDPFVHRALDEIIRIDQEQLPIIEPKCGENLLKEYHSLFECSVCGAFCDDTYPWDCDINFCPNCGARIKGANDDLLQTTQKMVLERGNDL